MKLTGRNVPAALTLAWCLVLGGGLVAPATGQPAEYLEPRDLPRGADPAIPHVEGRTFVDGDRRVPIAAGQVTLLGASGTSFVLSTSSRDGLKRVRLLRLDADGGTRVLLRGQHTRSATLTSDGRRLVQALPIDNNRTRVSSWSARTGALRARHVVRGYHTLLDADRQRAVLTDFRATYWLRFDSGERTRIIRRPGNHADIAGNRLATFTGDPYQDGCTVVARLNRPRAALWTSCRERVDSFSPDGGRMTTIDLLADGIGPRTVWLREATGRRLGRYTTNWFGATTWESTEAVLLEVNATHNAATVRCTDAGCETASELRPVVEPQRVH